jgi:hypothetical protein
LPIQNFASKSDHRENIRNPIRIFSLQALEIL